MKLQSTINRLLLTFCICSANSSLFAQKIAVAADKMNVFYLGLDNPITITAANCPCSKLLVKATNGTIGGAGCTYHFNPDQVGIAHITVFEKKDGKLKKLGTSDFRVKMIPLPALRIGPYGSNNIGAQRAVLAAQQYVRAEFYNLDYDFHISVDSFRVTILRDSAETRTFVNISGKLSDEIRDAFSLLKKNDIVVFDHIAIHSELFDASAIKAYATYYDDGTPKDEKPKAPGTDKTKIELDPLTLKIYD